MSSDTRGVSEAESQGTRSSGLPSHPVMFNDSDMDEASRSVSPEPLTQKKVAPKHAPSEGTSTLPGPSASCQVCTAQTVSSPGLYALQVLRPPCTPM